MCHSFSKVGCLNSQIFRSFQLSEFEGTAYFVTYISRSQISILDLTHQSCYNEKVICLSFGGNRILINVGLIYLLSWHIYLFFGLSFPLLHPSGNTTAWISGCFLTPLDRGVPQSVVTLNGLLILDLISIFLRFNHSEELDKAYDLPMPSTKASLSLAFDI